MERLSLPTTLTKEFKVLLNQFCWRTRLRVFWFYCSLHTFLGSDHPNPGEPYSGLFCTSYLPNNPAGQDLCKLLKSAFLARLIFTIGKSPATEEENKIVSNGIELKWNRSGGPAK